MTFAMYGTRKNKELLDLWKEVFDIVPEVVGVPYFEHALEPAKTHIFSTGWAADYPDPHTFLLEGGFHRFLREAGWEGLRPYNNLLDEALRSTDRTERLEYYRRADRLLVEEEVLLVPMLYGMGPLVSLVKPYVRGYRPDALGLIRTKALSIMPH